MKWKTAQGDLLEIGQMKTLHINNCITALKEGRIQTKNASHWIPIFEQELINRFKVESKPEYLIFN